MSEPAVCRHCGYFLDYRIPKAPGEPSWAHTLQTPTKPAGPPCDTPEPRAVNPADPRPATDGPVEWDSAAPRRPSDLPEFLLARFAEDEEMARDAAGWDKAGTERSTGCWHRVSYGSIDDEDDRIVVYSEGQPGREQADHIARWDPARVLAECEAKRRIVELEGCYACSDAWTSCEHREMTFCLLALPYADHPDYSEEWRP